MVGDFLSDRVSRDFGSVLPTYERKTTFAPLAELFPPAFIESLKDGILGMGKKLQGFDNYDALLTGVESRATCPVRMVRGEDYQSPVKGIFPIGEGAGFAGGIMSSAMDGMKAVESYWKELMV